MYLVLEDLTVSFDGFVAVDSVNISINRGEKRVIIGPNGAGKTTIIDMITGKTKPTKGKILFEGTNIAGMDPNEIVDTYSIGRKFQGPNVFDNMSVYENLEVSLNGYSRVWKTFTYRRKQKIKERLDILLEQINLTNQRDMYPHLLSHGQRQWLEIGMVLAQDPYIVILDEPAAGMTDNETYKTGEMLKNNMKDKTLIVVEHDMDFVKQIADKVTVLNQGKVLAEGTYEEISHNNDVIEVYLKTIDEERDSL